MFNILQLLKEKKEFDLDAIETTLQHREIILNKPFLKKLYEEWYHSFINKIPGLPEGKLLEIGSGGGFLKQIYPDIITSDIMDLSLCDMTFSAENIPFQENSLCAIFMIDVLHHIPHCKKFFKEAERTLKPGGIIFMIEPANTFFSRFIWKNLHHEPFDPNAGWGFPASGPLSGANGAIPWIVFKRDIDIFHELFPALKLRSFIHHTPFRYLITGGLSYKSIVPGWSFKGVTLFEKLFAPLNHFTAMFQTIEVIKFADS